MSPLGQTYSTAFLITSTCSSLFRRSSSTRIRSRSCCTRSGGSAAHTTSAIAVSPRRGIAVDKREKRRHMTYTPLPAKGCCCERLDQVSWLTDRPTPCAFPAVRPVASRRFRPRSQLRGSTGLAPASLTPGCAGSHLHLRLEPSCEGLQRLTELAVVSPDGSQDP